MSLLSAIGGFFGSSGFAKTANDAIRKIGGLNEMSPNERVTHFKDILKLTQSQSPARRVIAFIVAFAWLLMIICWLVCMFVGLEAELKLLTAFMKENITQPFNIILGFYFAAGLVSGLKK